MVYSNPYSRHLSGVSFERTSPDLSYDASKYTLNRDSRSYSWNTRSHLGDCLSPKPRHRSYHSPSYPQSRYPGLWDDDDHYTSSLSVYGSSSSALIDRSKYKSYSNSSRSYDTVSSEFDDPLKPSYSRTDYLDSKSYSTGEHARYSHYDDSITSADKRTPVPRRYSSTEDTESDFKPYGTSTNFSHRHTDSRRSTLTSADKRTPVTPYDLSTEHMESGYSSVKTYGTSTKTSHLHTDSRRSILTSADKRTAVTPNDLSTEAYGTSTNFSDLHIDSRRSTRYSSDISIKGDGTNGLKNLGNTCFMNSILQCLSNTLKLRDYVIHGKYTLQLNGRSSLKGKLFKAFADVLRSLWSSNGAVVETSKLKSKIEKLSSRFVGYDQHDCQEFLRILLDGLHEETNQVQKQKGEPLRDLSHLSDPIEQAKEAWKWFETKDKSFIFDLFVGQLQSSLECMECEHLSLTFDPFWDLSLPIFKPSNTLSSAYSSLDDCLKDFTKEELLDGEDKPVCEKCGSHQKMKKTLLIHRFPEILVIHLKRFREGRLCRQKLSNLVAFPDALNLRKFATDTCEDGRSSNYELYAVSNHSGTSYAGHYTAYCKNPKTKNWQEFNDHRVSMISEEHIYTKNAYVLFYVQKKGSGGM